MAEILALMVMVEITSITNISVDNHNLTFDHQHYQDERQEYERSLSRVTLERDILVIENFIYM